MKKEIEALSKIEQKNKSYNNTFAREMSIWEDIAGWINGTTGKEKDFWCRVMDLYKEKYRE